MVIYICKIHVGNIIYTANITKDLIDNMIANEDKSPVLEMLEQANIDKAFSYQLHNMKVEVISYEPLGMDAEMESDESTVPEVPDATGTTTHVK